MTAGTTSERDLLKRAADALMACATASLTVKPELSTPYADRPEWTPYTRHVERPADEATELAAQIRKHLRERHRDGNDQPRTDSRADDPLGELRWELGARTRQLDQVRKDYRALTEQVITALSTGAHHMTARGGLPFCECGLSLGGGDASGSFITHALAVTIQGES